MRVLIRAWVICTLLSFAAVQTNAPNPAAVASMQAKLDHIASNAATGRPDQAPTVLTEEEVNAYIASGQIKLPAGVQSVRLQAQPGVVNGNSRVDFDALKAGRHSSNPLLGIFSGVHDVEVNADAHGSGGQGYVHVNSVSLDGVEIPRFVLQLFVEKYLQPKYPNIGLDSRFALPARIDTATVGLHNLTLTQK
jgi:hypothetical protein